MRLIKTIIAAFLFCTTAKAQHTITVKADKPIAAVQPTMWGIFFEDINFGADGGIYAELVKNRSFEFSMPLMGWTFIKINLMKEVCWCLTGRKKIQPIHALFALLKMMLMIH